MAEEINVERGLGRHEEDEDDRFGRKVNTTFGSVRFDAPPAQQLQSPEGKSKPNSVDEKYFGEYQRRTEEAEKTSSPQLKSLDELYKAKLTETLSPIDEQYFGSYLHEERAASRPELDVQHKPDFASNVELSSSDLNPIDAEYFGSCSRVEKEASNEIPGLNLFGGWSEVIRFPTTPSRSTVSGTEQVSLQKPTSETQPDVVPAQVRTSEAENGRVEVRTIMNEPVIRETDVFNVEEPETAFDYAMKLRLGERSEKEARSGKFGFEWWKMTQEEIYRVLHSSVIYNENDIVAFDKPYGISCQGGPANDLSFISKHLGRLAVDLGAQDGQLHYIHRLDKNCTGVVVFAKTPEMAALLKASFAQRKVVKIYWAILKGTPEPPEGIIDIPIAEGRIGERRRMVLKPQFRPDIKGKNGTPARTYYKVLATRGNAALAELRPETGIKHQLRVHTSVALSCGILGDHKYAFRDKLAPQRLSGSILGALGIRVQDTRDLPLHLHAKCLIFPELLDGRNLFIQAEVPKDFKKTLRKLRLKAS